MRVQSELIEGMLPYLRFPERIALARFITNADGDCRPKLLAKDKKGCCGSLESDECITGVARDAVFSSAESCTHAC